MRAVLTFVLTAGVAVTGPQTSERTFKSDALIGQVSFSVDSTQLIGIGSDRAVRIWEVASGNLLRTVTWDKQYRFGATVSPQGYILAAGGGPDKVIKLWDLNSGAVAQQLPVLPEEMRGGSRFSSDGKFLATTYQGDQVRVWEIPSGKLRFTAKNGIGGTAAFAFSPNNNLLAGATNDTNIQVWRVRDGQLIRVIDELPLLTRAMQFTPTGAFLISAGVDQRVYFWDAQTWKRARQFEERHPESILSMDLSADGRLLVTGGLDVTDDDNPAHLVLWDVESGKPLNRVRLPHALPSVAFSPDGRWIAAANRRNNVLLWRLSDLRP